ncbi:MAG: hypothetical protein J6U28_00740 [Bacteroidales bacterium]|nr:hypothetical protein [Bacteroidales bacterium]
MDDTIPDGVSLLGKELTDLQSGVSIGQDAIAGTLKYVTGYTGFSGDPAEQEGHYIALHIDTDVEADSIVSELIGGDHGPVELDSDRTIIIRIKNKQQKIKIVAKKEGYPDVERIYNLAGLTLEPASN